MPDLKVYINGKDVLIEQVNDFTGYWKKTLHVPFAISKELSKNRPNLDEKENYDEYLKNAEKTYIELSELYNWKRINCVSMGSLKKIDEINEKILQVVLDGVEQKR